MPLQLLGVLYSYCSVIDSSTGNSPRILCALTGPMLKIFFIKLTAERQGLRTGFPRYNSYHKENTSGLLEADSQLDRNTYLSSFDFAHS